MADYNRFIAYIYLYDQNSKVKNIGFIKIEIRNSQCKIDLHIKGLYNGKEEKADLYLFHRKGNMIQGIYIDSFSILNGMADYRRTLRAENVAGSGYSMNDMGGMILEIDRGRKCATEWDDMPIQFENVTYEEEKAEGSGEDRKRETGEEQKYDKIKDIEEKKYKEVYNKDEYNEKDDNEVYEEREQRDQDTYEDGINEMNVNEMIKDDYEDGKDRFSEEKYKEESEGNDYKKGGQDDLEIEYEYKKDDNEQYLKEQSIKDEVLKLKNKFNNNNYEQMENDKKLDEDNTKEELKEGNSEKAETQKEESKINANWFLGKKDWLSMQKPDGKSETAKTLKGEEKGVNSYYYKENPLDSMYNNQMQYDTWKRFCEAYPGVHPVEGDEDTEYLRITIKDITSLAKKEWILSNNSFLIHGYYNYRYLILGKNHKTNVCIIGIPGYYHPKEQMMASMFGFPVFRSSMNKEIVQGDFGYWLKEVEI